MAGVAEPSFDEALIDFERARRRLKPNLTERKSERLLALVDDALDAILRAPSPSVMAFGQKLRLLESEYGPHVQPRHMTALYADAACLNSPPR